MPITFNCACGKVLRVPDTSAGKRAKCPVCSAVVTVPEPEPVLEIVEVLDVAELVPPPLPPEPEAPPAAPRPAGYGKPRFADDEEDHTPYGLAESEPSSSALDRNGNARPKGPGLPNFNKGRKNYG